MELFKTNLNAEKLQEILDCFVEITGIRSAYINGTAENMTGNHMDLCAFCKAAKRVPYIADGCVKSDQEAFRKARDTGRVYLYRCHIGLWEAVIPLFVKSRSAGYLMIGQVKCCDSGNVMLDIRALLESLKLPGDVAEDIVQKYGLLHEYRMNQIEAASKMLELIAQNIMNSDIISLYDSTAIEKAREYLRQHYTENVPIRNIALELDISPSSLMSLFKKQVGLTLTGYREALRMDLAKELLLMTSLEIKEIAYRCGYEDPNYFTRVFKKAVKSSPFTFRAENKK
jgi:AraC-like DNA-binding protein